MSVEKQKQIHKYRKQTSGYQWGEEKEDEVKKYELLRIK